MYTGYKRAMVALASLAVAAGLAACGSTSSNTTTAAASASTSKYSADLAQLYKGKIVPPPTSGPKGLHGKTVWEISCGAQFLACSTIDAGFKQAAAALGWKATVVDGMQVPNTVSQYIRQAIAAHVDAIIVTGADCITIKPALEAAKAAGIPVVANSATDCTKAQGGPLFTTALFANQKTSNGYLAEWDALKAEYIIDATKGTAKVIDLHAVNNSVQVDAHAAFLKEMSTCSTCKIVDSVPFTFTNPAALTQLVSAALLQHPEATAINVPADTLIPPYVAPAVERAHRAGKILVMGGEGYPPNFALVRKGVETAEMAYSNPWIGWGSVDVVNRVLSHEPASKIPNEGDGFQALDINHGLPPAGQGYTPPVNFEAAYKKIWGVG